MVVVSSVSVLVSVPVEVSVSDVVSVDDTVSELQPKNANIGTAATETPNVLSIFLRV